MFEHTYPKLLRYRIRGWTPVGLSAGLSRRRRNPNTWISRRTDNNSYRIAAVPQVPENTCKNLTKSGHKFTKSGKRSTLSGHKFTKSGHFKALPWQTSSPTLGPFRRWPNDCRSGPNVRRNPRENLCWRDRWAPRDLGIVSRDRWSTTRPSRRAKFWKEKRIHVVIFSRVKNTCLRRPRGFYLMNELSGRIWPWRLDEKAIWMGLAISMNSLFHFSEKSQSLALALVLSILRKLTLNPCSPSQTLVAGLFEVESGKKLRNLKVTSKNSYNQFIISSIKPNSLFPWCINFFLYSFRVGIPIFFNEKLLLMLHFSIFNFSCVMLEI